MANLRVNGWGPFPVPGEKARLRRLEMEVDRLFAAHSDTGGEEKRSEPGPGHLEEQRKPVLPAVGRTESERAAPPERGGNLGERKIFFEGQAGADVVELQQRLSSFGFLPEGSISGNFDNRTKEALREFQHDFGIYVDGVAGTVTAKVVRFLDSIDYNPDQLPVPNDIMVLIQRVARSQRLGIVLIGNTAIADQNDADQPNARLDIISNVSQELVNLLNDHPILQGAVVPEGYTWQRTAQLADSIDAEMVIYLDVADDSDREPGIASYFFSIGKSESAIGTPLARSIHNELTRITGVNDRGAHGVDSHVLQQPEAPTVRVVLGNLGNKDDARRLRDPEDIRMLANAIMQGISRLYDLELPEATATRAK